MLPSIGEEVQLTDEYINVDSTRDSLKGQKLDVLKVDLQGITKNGPEYSIWFSYAGTVDGIEVDNNGHSLKFSDKRVVVFRSWSGGFAPSKQKAAGEEDRCKRCGTIGRISGMSCLCPDCGQVIWGI
jgi:hypothetical protein